MAHDPDLVASLWAEYKPRIDAARKAERESGDQAFLDLNEERIGPFPAVHLTPEKYLLLDKLGCLSESITQASLKRFLWVVSPKFKPTKWAGKWFMLRNWKVTEEVAIEVADYMSRTFSAMPGRSGAQGASAIGWVASMVDLLASEYGWKEKEILTCPLRRVFQYVQSIMTRKTGKETTLCSKADDLQAEFMRKANEGI